MHNKYMTLPDYTQQLPNDTLLYTYSISLNNRIMLYYIAILCDTVLHTTKTKQSMTELYPNKIVLHCTGLCKYNTQPHLTDTKPHCTRQIQYMLLNYTLKYFTITSPHFTRQYSYWNIPYILHQHLTTQCINHTRRNITPPNCTITILYHTLRYFADTLQRKTFPLLYYTLPVLNKTHIAIPCQCCTLLCLTIQLLHRTKPNVPNTLPNTAIPIQNVYLI